MFVRSVLSTVVSLRRQLQLPPRTKFSVAKAPPLLRPSFQVPAPPVITDILPRVVFFCMVVVTILLFCNPRCCEELRVLESLIDSERGLSVRWTQMAWTGRSRTEHLWYSCLWHWVGAPHAYRQPISTTCFPAAAAKAFQINCRSYYKRTHHSHPCQNLHLWMSISLYHC